MSDDRQQHISTTDARAGSTPHMTRYILAFGLVLVIAAFIAIVLLWR
jgi:Flp pilus assembly protein TadB